MEKLQRDISSLTSAAPSDIHLRALGHAYGLAALLAVIPDCPLYVSYDISAKVFDMAVQILKRAGEHNVKVAQVEIEIAWTCIGSLMTLGLDFVRPHLPHLLVLWRNALPKPTTRGWRSKQERCGMGVLGACTQEYSWCNLLLLQTQLANTRICGRYKAYIFPAQ